MIAARARAVGVDANHRDLDQVGRGALQRRVDRGALGKTAQVEVLAVDVGDRPHPAEQRRDFLIAARLLQRAVDELAHAAVLLKISVDEVLGLLGVDANLLRQPEGRQSIDDAEVHRLGAAGDARH